MVTDGPAEVLHDRRSEREVLERLLEAVRGGQSRVLVVRGEPGSRLCVSRFTEGNFEKNLPQVLTELFDK